MFVLLFFICSSISLYGIHFVDFDEGMSNSACYPHKLKQSADWEYLKKSYISNMTTKHYQDTPKIPKIIHHIWLGSKLPAQFEKLRNHWIELHPNWQHILWTDEDIEKFKLENVVAFKNARTYGEKSDIARYEILYRMGGLYVDTDFECLKSFDELHHTFDCYLGLLHSDFPEINNALIGASPGHPLFADIISHIKTNQYARDHAPMAVLNRTGSYMLSKKIISMNMIDSQYSIMVFPVNYFYPFTSYYKNEDHTKFIKPETMAVHHWACSWMK